MYHINKVVEELRISIPTLYKYLSHINIKTQKFQDKAYLDEESFEKLVDFMYKQGKFGNMEGIWRDMTTIKNNIKHKQWDEWLSEPQKTQSQPDNQTKEIDYEYINQLKEEIKSEYDSKINEIENKYSEQIEERDKKIEEKDQEIEKKQEALNKRLEEAQSYAIQVSEKEKEKQTVEEKYEKTLNKYYTTRTFLIIAIFFIIILIIVVYLINTGRLTF